MLKSPFLRNFIWVSAGITIVANLVVIVKHVRGLRDVTNTKSVQFVNLFLLFNLACSDIIMGILLLMVGIKSAQFSGDYCSADLTWRTSTTCNIIGMLTVISSQSSINLLVLMTAVRLFVTLWPLKAREIRTRVLFLLCFISWSLAVFFALLPNLGEFLQKLWIKPNVYFTKNIVFQNKVDQFYARTKLISEHNTKNKFANSKALNSFTKIMIGDALNPDLFPDRNIKIEGRFGYYSSSSVCIPNFYSTTSPHAEYSLFLIIYNLLALIMISISYALIFKHTMASRKQVQSKKDAKIEAQTRKMKIKITCIVVTDMLCWLPIIVMSCISYYGYQLPGVVHAVSAIILLPINCAINPVIYAGLDEALTDNFSKIITRIASMCRCCTGDEGKDDTKELVKNTKHSKN